MRKIIITLCLIIYYGIPVYAFEKKVYYQLNFEGGCIKEAETTNTKRINTVNFEIDSEVSLIKETKLVLYPIINYDFEAKKGRVEYQKVYFAGLIKNFYFGIGRQPIIWGVARGRNPSNYFQEIEISEKQRDKKWREKGVDSVIFSYIVKDNIYEVVFSDKEAFALRLKTFKWGTDLSTSFYHDYSKGKSKGGFDFEGSFLGWFNIYNEFAWESETKYKNICGISRQISSYYKSNLDIEYLYDKENKDDYLLGQYTLSPAEELDCFVLFLYELNPKIYYFMSRISLYLKRLEITLTPSIPLNKKDERPTVIVGKISYNF